MRTEGRGWWIDDDGFLRHPDNVLAFDIEDAASLLDDREQEHYTLTAENARLKEALAWMIDEVSVLGFDRMPGDTMADLVKASDNARDVMKGGA